MHDHRGRKAEESNHRPSQTPRRLALRQYARVNHRQCEEQRLARIPGEAAVGDVDRQHRMDERRQPRDPNSERTRTEAEIQY